jgi:hypothetical protein
VSSTLNLRAASFVRRTLFLAEPEGGRPTASLAVSQLAAEFCLARECERYNSDRGCRKHAHAVLLGGSKLISTGEVLAELSLRGVVFVRLSPAGVLAPESWTTIPHWWYDRPDLVQWARTDFDRRRWEARV